jgi:hypothetical protein
MNLYSTPEDRGHALVIAAAVAAHAIVAGGQFAHSLAHNLDTEEGREDIVRRAFGLAEKFLAEAERRIASAP